MDCPPKKWPLWSGGRCREVETRVNVWTVPPKKVAVVVTEVAVVQRFKQESMYGLSAKKNGRCREVAVSRGLTV